LALDAGNAVFVAAPHSETGFSFGIYTTLGATPEMPLRKVIAPGDTLDGKAVDILPNISREAISGRSITFQVYFTDGTSGIYRADAPFRWMSAGGGNFGDAANWLLETLPGTADRAVFDLPGSFNIALTTTHAVGGMLLGPSTAELATVNLLGEGRIDLSTLEVQRGGRLNLPGRNLKVGPAGLNTVENVVVQVHARQSVGLHEGARIEGITQAIIDGPAAAPPTVIASGAGTVLKAAAMVIGDTGAGRLTVGNGARVDVPPLITVAAKPGSSGYIEVHGIVGPIGEPSSLPAHIVGSTLVLGDQGSATMLVRDGAQVGIDVTLIGDSPGGKGKLTITGAGSRYLGAIESADIVVGNQGWGELFVGDKARVNATLHVGTVSTGTGTVLISGAGTILTSPELRVGLAGTGVVHAVSGARINSTVVDIGVQAGGKGLLKLEGPGTKMVVESELLIDEFAVAKEAFLIVANGAAVEMSTFGQFGIGGSGVLELRSGGSFTAPDGVNSGTIVLDGGTLNVPSLETYGGIIIGNSPGSGTINGNLRMRASGYLEIEVGGSVPGVDYDVLTINGDVVLGGTLKIIFLDGFVPEGGAAFAFLDISGSVSGGFANVEIAGLDPALRLQLELGERGVAAVAAPVPEPLALWSMLAGLGAVACAYRTRRRGFGQRSTHTH
jgi:T5SS/PEP-CTERM-associated repeat protein